ncbi:nitroreductase family deazaflavin-dependent oxidoreductase [Amycolatopsis benzoatilytica]|uniref:nitroreductase family deazaflavin-dependent oxidoreductase n=1 Tax=Amycolatopsis benzoatilytica TaxID=346045 RepID=UPI0003A38020|nr:nitroreductase family deazaflavin-dependent oxidoreductase [Amycolatopsis benzoatilytica]
MSTMDRDRTSGTERPAKDPLRAFVKHIVNPLMMRVAGSRHWYAAVIRHTGRRSGKAYATPVVADRAGNGFVIPLPYGTGVDWLRNVLAAGRATVQARGETYEVTAPQIIDAATAWPQVPAAHARVWRRLGIAHYLHVTIRTDQP